MTNLKMWINNDFSEYLEVNTGVWQGYSLSVILFRIVTDKIIRKLNVRGNIAIGLTQICTYAGDIFILAGTQHSVIHTFLKLKIGAEKVCLIVNENKRKSMKLN